VSLERLKIAEAESVPDDEDSMCTVARRDGDAPPGSRAILCTKSHFRDWRDPAGSADVVTGGDVRRGRTGALRRAEAGSRTDLYCR